MVSIGQQHWSRLTSFRVGTDSIATATGRRTVVLIQAARRSASTLCSQLASGFQLVKIRLTNLRSATPSFRLASPGRHLAHRHSPAARGERARFLPGITLPSLPRSRTERVRPSCRGGPLQFHVDVAAGAQRQVHLAVPERFHFLRASMANSGSPALRSRNPFRGRSEHTRSLPIQEDTTSSFGLT